ncbi:nucleolar protein of 40 kDa [Neodiprion lecontei]|uniref:Nucleolar protein of 40 kDa n=1 Tax=Neodiprion lecontei TaxID=441921 RepID=A0A6J0BHI7_NEOLC|nr:nucleolar protein of 40 kDa [Neodiprion lecontei]
MTGCELNQIFLGEVAAVQNYGAFVRIPGCTQQGLVHKSQVSSSHVDDVGDVLQRGERVWCKIISINEEGKISLSMKLVNQGNGTDLDPNGVQLQRDEQKRKTTGPNQRKVIQLQAVLNTTCAKCGTHGHLSSDCFMSPGGKTYELIPDIEGEDKTEEATKPEIEEGTVETKIKKHKSKKSKSKKKSKKSKSNEEPLGNDSDSEDGERGKKSSKKRSKDKKRKRKKEKKGRDNSSQSNSTDEDDKNGDEEDIDGIKSSLKRKISELGKERRTKKCKYSSSKR